MTSRDLGQALDAWAAVLGVEHVDTQASTLRLAGTATFQTSARVDAILRPETAEEVRACVAIARQFGIPLHPVSSGKNWGYGSSAPVQSSVLLDLRRMNRILAYDEELAYVTIEPGVTQRQLHAFLVERGGRLWMDATGASPDCSIIGNTLERGFGHTPMGDHAGSACGLDVVLPTGECISTGFGRFARAGVASLNRSGVGPSLDGLFFQSNLGFVVSMTVWLMPAPESFQAFFFMCKSEDGLAAAVDALRPLRLAGVVRSVVHIGNDYKVIAASAQRTALPSPVTPDTMAQIRARMRIGVWNGSGGLYGTPAQVRDAKRRVRRALAGKVDRLQFVDDRLLRFMTRFQRPFRWMTGWDVSRVLAVLTPVYNLLKGVPTDATLASAYWRKDTPVPAKPDPDRDGCGLLWCSPVVPSVGRDLEEVASVAQSTLLRHGFEPQMSVSLATDRSSICVITISYDRRVPGEDARAQACYEELSETLIAKGYPPYRLNVASMHLMSADGPYGDLLRRIKQAFDPAGICAPGRYEAVELTEDAALNSGAA